MFGEHVAGAEAELEGVPQVDGNGDAFVETLVDGGLDGGVGGEDPGGAGEVNGDGMNVDAGDLDTEPFEHVLAGETVVFGGFDQVGDGLGDEGAGAAGGVEDGLVQRVGHHLADHCAGEPVGV